jgi:hypothetical protein
VLFVELPGIEDANDAVDLKIPVTSQHDATWENMTRSPSARDPRPRKPAVSFAARRDRQKRRAPRALQENATLGCGVHCSSRQGFPPR